MLAENLGLDVIIGWLIAHPTNLSDFLLNSLTPHAMYLHHYTMLCQGWLTLSQYASALVERCMNAAAMSDVSPALYERPISVEHCMSATGTRDISWAFCEHCRNVRYQLSIVWALYYRNAQYQLSVVWALQERSMSVEHCMSVILQEHAISVERCVSAAGTPDVSWALNQRHMNARNARFKIG